MIGDLTEEVFKKELQKLEKSRQKKNEIHDILTTYQNVTRDQLRLIVDNQRNLPEIQRICQELFTLRVYINEQMSIVSKRYTCVTPRIIENWMVLNAKG
jgi:GTP1/Obg family GTP-binding protein